MIEEKDSLVKEFFLRVKEKYLLVIEFFLRG
jgi:hypothetical protein